MFGDTTRQNRISISSVSGLRLPVSDSYMSKYWFERTWRTETEALNRRRGENRLQRIARNSQEQDEGRIKTWLELAKKMFDKDDDPDPQAA